MAELGVEGGVVTDWSTLAYFFWECPVCRAAVSRASREEHEEWHRPNSRLLRRLAKGRRSFWYWPSAEAPLRRSDTRRRLVPVRRSARASRK